MNISTDKLNKSIYPVKTKLFDKRIWKIGDVAEYLGCSKKTIYKKVTPKEIPKGMRIPSFKKGKFRYFIPSEVENWLLEGDTYD